MWQGFGKKTFTMMSMSWIIRSSTTELPVTRADAGLCRFISIYRGFVMIFFISATIGLKRSICPTPMVIPLGAAS